MSVWRIALVVLLAGVMSIGTAILGQRWLDNAATRNGSAERGTSQRQILPELSLLDLDGRPVESHEWAGKIVILHYWATWCPPCVRELPLLIETQARLGDGIQIVGIAVDRREDVVSFIASTPINYPILIADPAPWHSPSSSATDSRPCPSR